MGAQTSSSRNEIQNIIRNSIKATIEQNIDAQAAAACQNIQSATRVQDCQIEFSPQVCKAVLISNFTGDQAQSSKVSQEVLNEIIQQSSAATSGLTVGFNSSNSSNFTKNVVEMSMDTSQSFMTNCTRSISNVNTQTVKDCSASAIKFAEQQADSEVIGDCVMNQAGELQAAQALTNTVDMTSEAITEGFDPMMLMMGLAVFFLGIFFIIPILKAVMSSVSEAMSGDKEAAKSEAKANLKMKTYVLAILTLLFLASCCIWWPWPGYYARELGVAPYYKVNTNPNPVFTAPDMATCREGQSSLFQTFVNPFMWYDPYCLTSGGTACTADKKQKSYQNCGIFAKNAGCDDPEFLESKREYLQMHEECAKVAGANYKYCTSEYIASDIFAQEPEAYGSCQLCTEGPLWGMWVREGADCLTAKVDKYAFQRQENTKCEPGDVHCKQTLDDLMKVSPDDCRHTAYQTSKKAYSEALRVCDKIEEIGAVTTVTNDGEKPLMVQQCPPDVFDYLNKCDKSTKRCSYTSPSGDPVVQASCENNFDKCCTKTEDGKIVCADDDFEKDFMLALASDAACQEKWERHKSLNPWAIYVTLAAYLLYLFTLIYILSTAPAIRRGALNGIMGRTKRKARGFMARMQRIVIFLVFLGMFLICAPFWGLIGYYQAGMASSMYTTPEDSQLFHAVFTQRQALIVGSIGFTIGLAAMLNYLITIFRWVTGRKSKDEEEE